MAKTNDFLDFIPPELRKGKKGDWIILYKCKDPSNGKLIRRRNRVPHHNNSKEREKIARTIINEINKKLYSGWNPFLDQVNIKKFSTLQKCIELFIDYKKKELNDNSIRQDTFRSYKSHFNMFKKWLEITKQEDIFSIKFTADLIQSFLDYIYYELENSPRTYNNYLTTLTTFSGFLLNRGYINQNPCDFIKNKKNNPKVRTIIPFHHLQLIKKYFEDNIPDYNVLILMTLFCLVRRTELTKLRVKDIQLSNRLLIVPAKVSKNRKIGEVTLPKNIIHQLSNHIANANQNDFIFSKTLKPGKEQLSPRYITDTWAEMRTYLKLPKEYQFYSLKDTGIR